MLTKEESWQLRGAIEAMHSVNLGNEKELKLYVLQNNVIALVLRYTEGTYEEDHGVEPENQGDQ